MEITQRFLTQNNCYKSGRTHIVRGIMWHSTGSNNPNLNRYIPGDEVIGYSRYDNDWDTAQPGGRSVCVHAFIGLDKDKKVRIYQTLPWEMVGWHSGKGSLGGSLSANFTGYIGFEIQEDALTDPKYFAEVYAAAVWLTVFLAKKYKFPINKTTMIDHSAGYKMGIASNHGDVMHWFPKHGKSMDTARADVIMALAPPTVPAPTPVTPQKPQEEAQEYPNGIAYVTASVLNVRSGRGTKYPVIATLKKGTKVKLMWHKDGWWSIDVPLSVSKLGYAFISDDWISAKQDTPAEVQVVKRMRGKVVNCSVLNVRKAPNGKVAYTLRSGDAVDIVRKIGSWYELRDGYVYGKYIRII